MGKQGIIRFLTGPSPSFPYAPHAKKAGCFKGEQVRDSLEDNVFHLLGRKNGICVFLIYRASIGLPDAPTALSGCDSWGKFYLAKKANLS